jgi:hypothetical protein
MSQLISPTSGISKDKRDILMKVLSCLKELFPTDPQAKGTKNPLPFNLIDLYIELAALAITYQSPDEGKPSIKY